ncbi:hypothetical protein K1T71_002980 [Dendrolimus kikuchii]|uniref:Uncharacterized protein n=1 Tax=Dendrolimus kikuchii TaxID=765133 RepID=A0ACC1DAM6_9NEOP|nr:hypothetical protein K1T71_002980 [Dendrolimus kikuchii]
MNAEDESIKKKEKSPNEKLTVSMEDTKKGEKIDLEDPKPRIVLTIRSEKSSAKSNNMKIVSTEEKHEEFSPRRSSRTRGKWIWVYDDAGGSPKKDKSSENEELETTQGKRSASRRNKDSDNIVANAIARKEKLYDYVSGAGPQRLTRRKPKVIEDIDSEPPEKGVRTRRSARPTASTEEEPKAKTQKVKDTEVSDDDSQDSSAMKLKHLCELGLKAIDPEDEDQGTGEEAGNEDPIEDKDDEEFDVDGEEEELDEDSELMEDSDSDDPKDEDFCYSPEASPHPKKVKGPTRRSSRRTTSHTDDTERSCRSKKKRTRSPDADEPQSETEQEENSNPAGGDEGTEAACPEDDTALVATCYCETPSNVYADPEELVEPVFCQAIELVDGIRVGCSHGARKVDGVYAPLVRAGPRAPFFLACTLHAKQLVKHMCCSACGLFCTQGIFYQCNLGHLFHLDCGLPYNEAKLKPGCPHCGVHSYRWQPANRECSKVNVQMNCSNKRIFLPDQREQCTPAYLTFSSLAPSQLKQDPVIPEELLPSPPIDLKQICQREGTKNESPQPLYETIVSGGSIEELIPKIVSGKNINQVFAGESGGTCAHAAASRGHLAALYLLQYAGANLDALDANMRTPLLAAVTALLDKSDKKPKEKTMNSKVSDVEAMEVDTKEGKSDDSEKSITEEAVGRDSTNDENLLKVIKYLVAAGCDVNLPDSDGMTPLHVAAQHGSEEVCAVIVGAAGAEVDPKDHGGWTPLVWAAENSHSNVVKLLLSAGADASSCDAEGNAAVHWCALAGAAPALLHLLHRAPHCVDAINAHTDTPLHVAARQGHYSCVVILLARGARTDVENSAGELPVEVCSDKCQSAISLNMQMTLAVKDKFNKRKLLSSDISRGRELYPVPCINEVDDEPLPEDFTYITSHVMPQLLSIDSTIPNMQGCDCKDGDCSSSTCGCVVLSVRKWYKADRLHPSFPYHDPPMLFECNETCGCNAKRCTNMVVSRLCKQGSLGVRAEVFRVGAATGWGLRASRAVKRGAPVATYCGELLALPEADTRTPDHYMFALDLKPDLLEQCDDTTQLCVDAANYGSAARFINHSCSPNLAPVRVFTNSRDLRMPTVALFATKDIAAEEELTFDYGDKFWSVKSKWMKCECGSGECRYPVRCDPSDA